MSSILLALGVVPVPKIIKMPMRDQHRKQEGDATPEFSNSHSPIVLSFPKETDASLDMITRWIKLADQALCKHGTTAGMRDCRTDSLRLKACRDDIFVRFRTLFRS
jgi:hypothetical protein